MTKIKNNQSAKPRVKRQKTATRDQRLTHGEIGLETRLPAPGNLVRRIRDEMDRLFEDLGVGNLTRSLPTTESLGLGSWAPEVEVFERQGDLVVRADLPGLTKDDIKLDVTEKAITIDGERRQEHEEREEGYYRSERSYGRFTRRIPLPEGVDIDTANAQFRDGVLEITFATPERKGLKSRKLEIGESSARAMSKATGR